MNKGEMLFKEIKKELTAKTFLKKINMTEEEMCAFLEESNFAEIACRMTEIAAGGSRRFSLAKTAELAGPALGKLCSPPQEGWLPHIYRCILGRLFPEKKTVDDAEAAAFMVGREVMLKLIRAVHTYEQKYMPFDPEYDMNFLEYEEIMKQGYNQEYLRFTRLLRQHYIYEFMRIGAEITPFNTLGHIAGVHYVAMHAAYQLRALDVPVDLALVSGAAAGHDIGKYGCRKSEEKRIPYLHYYYTDVCLNNLNMPMIAHIAANHSTWDLEVDNLSAESLLLIYADFRVKSSRGADGREQVNFYSLDDAFQVILDKLDNVDEAKEKRYRRVYNKLKDFEDYMVDLGVCTELPAVPQPVPDLPSPSVKKDAALMGSTEAVRELKYAAVDYNIRIMNLFYKEKEFTGVLEAARSEKKLSNLRMYISVFGEYSTYMTEKQKLLTIAFLSELLVNKESDIRNQAAEVMGRIIGRFNEEYKKELPTGASLPEKDITNFSLWQDTINDILNPDHKLTERHRRWMGNCLKSVISGILRTCAHDTKEKYIDILLERIDEPDLSVQNKEALLRTFMVIDTDSCNGMQRERIIDFAVKAASSEEGLQGHRIMAAEIRYRLGDTADEGEYISDLKKCLGLDSERKLTRKTFAEMFLDNMKARTPWAVKTANIRLMLSFLDEISSEGQTLHVAAHLANLIKVSETVTVRKAAGDGLISIIGRLPLEQRNEIAVELGKGLEIGDYQFTKYIPQYLGIIMLHLPPGELDELILDLKKLFEQSGAQVAGAVLHTFGTIIENYSIYTENFTEEPARESKKRRLGLLKLIMRGFASYNIGVSQEALWTMGELFVSDKLSMDEKCRIIEYCCKKILTLHHRHSGSKLDFYYNAVTLNHVYDFICDYELEKGPFQIADSDKVAFFPGTFDPFSLSHKAIAREICSMGCDVYLALDEFSWSKKTQPRLHRRKIMEMSVADEENIYIFPDHIPVNIANPQDLRKLRNIFEGKQLFFVAGSDVIENASCYRTAPSEDSIHSLNHIVFRRKSDARMKGNPETVPYPVTGEIINLRLEEFFEDISSTRIRENIDLGRDISSLIDPIAQNYITDYGLYLREPTYKHILQAKEIRIEGFGHYGESIIADLKEELAENGYDTDEIAEYLNRSDVSTLAIRDTAKEDRVIAAAAVHRDPEDEHTAVLGGLYFSRNSKITGLGQIILVEILSELIIRDFSRVVCRAGRDERTVKVIERQGFRPRGDGLYEVDMSQPVIIFKNVDTIIKDPLSKNKKVLRVIENAHNRLLGAITDMYPGQLVLSFNSNIIHHKMIQLIAKANKVSAVPYAEKKYGPYMAVPFSSMMESIAVPNTVTKDLYTEKYFSRDISAFTIEEQGFYSPLDSQVKIIKSFNRPVILVDNLLHKGYRMKELYPMLKKNGIELIDIVLGASTARGKKMMAEVGCRVDSAYYLPSLRCWLDETAVYPYIGGDSIKNPEEPVNGQKDISSINLTLPYAVPTFFGDIPGRNLYNYSEVCLENARDILKTLEEEYQNEYARELTLKRLGEVISVPKRPESDPNKYYDEHIAPSVYVEEDIEKLKRLRKLFI